MGNNVNNNVNNVNSGKKYAMIKEALHLAKDSKNWIETNAPTIEDNFNSLFDYKYASFDQINKMTDTYNKQIKRIGSDIGELNSRANNLAGVVIGLSILTGIYILKTTVLEDDMKKVKHTLLENKKEE